MSSRRFRRFRPFLCLSPGLLVRRAVLVGLLCLALAGADANAALTLYTDSDVGGFVSDSATDEFLAAIDDAPTEYISFATDRFGTPTPEDGAVDGGIFSLRLELSSPEASGMSSPDNVVVAAGGTGEARVGPSPGFSGTLEISFSSPYATAVGMGPINFGLSDTITVYDSLDEMLYSGAGASDNPFTFIGFTADADELIGRVVLEGSGEFGIQDLQFVPEPAASAQAIAAVAALISWRRARGRNR